jgi:AraC-like DNA-binding protein
MKSISLGEKEWLEVLFASGTELELGLGGYYSRFAPEPNWDTGPRRVDEHLIYFVAEGGCSAVLDGKRVRSAAGSLCWVCPETPFRFFHGVRDSSSVIYRFRFQVKEKGKVLRPRWPYRFLPEAWPLFDIVKQITLEAERSGKFSFWRVRNLFSLLSIAVFEASPGRRRGGTVLSDSQRAEIASLLSENRVARKTPADLARRLGLSAGYFTRVFRRSYGLSPRTWLLHQRVGHAGLLLRESTSRVSEIAEKLGYTEVYLFSRQFRQIFGVSPTQWRKSTV